MSKVSGLIRRMSLLLVKAPGPAVRLMLPFLVLNEEAKSATGYEEHNREARETARQYGLPLKEYITSADWSPDDMGVDDRPAPAPSAFEFAEWQEPGYPGSSRDPGLE